MEWSVLFLGPVGSGKTQAIRSVSDIDVVDTEALATDETAAIKQTTTVAMDVGVMMLGDGDKVVLYGAPGQDRFDFMWEILLQQVKGVVLLVNHTSPYSVTDLAHYLDRLEEIDPIHARPLVVGVTHCDQTRNGSLNMYRSYLQQRGGVYGRQSLPVCTADARSADDVKTLLLALTSMLEIQERFPQRSAA